jgi:hypothetical protein
MENNLAAPGYTSTVHCTVPYGHTYPYVNNIFSALNLPLPDLGSAVSLDPASFKEK